MKLKLSYVLALAALTLALLVDVLFYKAPNLGINVVLAEAAFVGLSMWLARTQRIRVTRPAVVAAGFAVLFAGTFAVWQSSWSLTMDFVALLIANMLFVAFLLGEEARFRHPLDVAHHLIVVPAKHALFALPFIRTLMPDGTTTRTRTVVKAILLTLPILLVFALILAGADAVFASYIERIITSIGTWLSIPNVFGHGIFVGFFFTLFCLFFAAAFWSKKTFPRTNEDPTARAVLESKIILGSVAVLFALFLLVSGAALFGGNAALVSLDITYAQYARQGFGQLCAVVVLVLGLLMTLRVLHTERTDKQLLGLHMALLGESALILVSAFMRLGMYIGAFGYTPARLFGLWFFTLIAVLLVLMCVNVARARHQSVLVMQAILVTGVAVLLFTALGPDTLATKLNATRTDLTPDELLTDTPRYHVDTWQSWNYTRSIAK